MAALVSLSRLAPHTGHRCHRSDSFFGDDAETVDDAPCRLVTEVVAAVPDALRAVFTQNCARYASGFGTLHAEHGDDISVQGGTLMNHSQTGEKRRRVRMTREAGQSLVLSRLCEASDEEVAVEVHISHVSPNGSATLEMLLPADVFVERKETLDGVKALFR